MDMNELRAFLAVADTGSLLAAADALGLPRSTLRRRLDDLEGRVGAPLLLRGAQGATLTEAGQLIESRGRRILQESQALIATAREVGGGRGGLLRVALPAGLPPHGLLPVFIAMRSSFPEMKIEARTFADPTEALEDGSDIAFLFGAKAPLGPYVTRVVLPLRERLIGSAAYLRERGSPSSLAELHQHELFSWSGPGVDPHRWPTLDGIGVEVRPVAVSPDVHLLRQLVLADLGLAFVPDALLPDPGHPEDAVVTLLPELIGRDCPLRVVIPEALARSPRVRAIQESLLAALDPRGG